MENMGFSFKLGEIISMQSLLGIMYFQIYLKNKFILMSSFIFLNLGQRYS